MTDLICRKTMRACDTPGMCSPWGGCTEPATDEIARLRAENERLTGDNERLRFRVAEIAGELDDAEEAAEKRITELERERDTATRALDALREMYAEEVTRLEGMKARGDLTAEWGECSLICARETFRNIAALSKTEGKE